MSETILENLFFNLNDSTEILQNELGVSYLEALLETLENVIHGKEARVEDGLPKEETVGRLNEIYAKIDLDKAKAKDIREALQLLLIKGSQADHVQAQHQMTPDAIGLIIAYLIDRLHDGEEDLHLLELGSGTGNLLFTLINDLEKRTNREISADGVEIDDLLIALAAVSADLQGHDDVTFSRQDALRPLYVRPADVVISDLPVGYYPDDENARTFDMANEEGHSFSHYLFLEQGLKYIKEGGLAFYLVPAHIFSNESSLNLVEYIREVGYFQGLIQLPTSFFKQEEARQSILILQKKGAEAKQAKEVLLAQAPDLTKDTTASRFLQDIENWYLENIK